MYAISHYSGFSDLWVIMMLILTDNPNSSEPLIKQLLNFLEFLESSKIVAKYVFVSLYLLLARIVLQEVIIGVASYTNK